MRASRSPADIARAVRLIRLIGASARPATNHPPKIATTSVADAGQRDVQDQRPLLAPQVGDVAADEHRRPARGLQRHLRGGPAAVLPGRPTWRSGSD